MYTRHFGLTRYPFENNLHADELFVTEAMCEAKRRIEHLLELRGSGLITGEAGCGKTTACRHVSETLHPGLYKVSYTALTTGTVGDTLQMICQALGLARPFRRASAWRAIQTEVKRLCDDKNLTPFLIIDEAHHLRNETLEDLRLLTNFDFDSKNRLCLLLVGTSELRLRLGMSVHESLTQRLIMNHHFATLSPQETNAYLNHRMQCAGAAQVSHFSPPATEAIQQATQGIIRQIDRIAHYTLMAAASDKAKQENEKHVETACQEVRL